MNPFCDRTTPRKLMAPISRHFLPVLQPEPPAWLTTGLMNGSRRPFALNLLSGATDCSASLSPSPAGVLLATGVLVFVTTSGFGCTLCWTPTAAIPLVAWRCFTGVEDFTGVIATALDLGTAWIAPTAGVAG